MICTRFAPSPTGDLHLGSARTALFAWAYARHHSGRFILRIEDTDQARSTPEACQSILDAMAWLGLDYDEGPYYQSKRGAHYRAALNRLLEAGQAYRCDCSRERLETLREAQLARQQKPRYDGYCRNRQDVPVDRPFVVRFRTPDTGYLAFQDEVYGRVNFENRELDDLVIARSDGTPTYNFTVVVDDAEMGVTHVIRGDDHLNNTPRQIHLFQALGASLPVYAHVPMIRGTDGKKLSKREGALNVMHYRTAGYLPEALLNYLVRLGWSQGDQELFSKADIIRHFDSRSLSKSPAVMNPSKLLWLNQHYLQAANTERLTGLLTEALTQRSITTNNGPPLHEVVAVQQGRVKTIQEMAEKSRFFYEPPKRDITQLPEEVLPACKQLRLQLHTLIQWEEKTIHAVLQQVAEQFQISFGQLAQAVRLAVTGGRISPPIDSTLKLLGKSSVLSRLEVVQKK